MNPKLDRLKRIMTTFLSLFTLFICLPIKAGDKNENQHERSFVYPVNTQTRVELIFKNGGLTYNVEREGGVTKYEIPLEVSNTVNVVIDDYNFDKNLDFSIWHLDDGMGTFTIHRVFVFSEKEGMFIENPPACSDEFLNLRIDKPNKSIVSTYYKENIPTICITRLQDTGRIP